MFAATTSWLSHQSCNIIDHIGRGNSVTLCLARAAAIGVVAALMVGVIVRWTIVTSWENQYQQAVNQEICYPTKP